MEPIKKRIDMLALALDRLHESLGALKHQDPVAHQNAYDQIRDSVIKRFEFCVDLFWKCLKDHLYEHHGLEVASPKTVLRESLSQKIIDSTELLSLIKMIDDRNSTSHCYDETLAQDIAQRIPNYAVLMEVIKKRLLLIENDSNRL